MNTEKEIEKAVAFGMGVICGKHNLEISQGYIKQKAREYINMMIMYQTKEIK